MPPPDDDNGCMRPGCGRDAAGLLTVLIVDDDEAVRGLGRRIVSTVPGVEIEAEAESGEAALLRLEEQFADVVLMDWSMAGIDGVEATARILGMHPDVRVVGWTSSSDPGLHAAFREAGAVATFVKSDVRGLATFLDRLRNEATARANVG